MTRLSADQRPGRESRLRDSTRWFSEGRDARRAARLSQRCVECRTPLATRRTPYCSRRCQWKFHGRFFWDAARKYVLRRDRFTCQRCGTRRRCRELEVDHIWEIALGGPTLEYANLQTLCKECHREKTRSFLRGRRPATGVESDGAADSDWFPA